MRHPGVFGESLAADVARAGQAAVVEGHVVIEVA
jgi:hypothetical protein